MKLRPLTCASLGLLLAVGASLLLVAGTPAHAKTDTYLVDASHSTVLFKINHLGVSWAYGRFNDFNGSFCVDDADLSKANVEVDISAESVDTGNEDRDKHVRNADFLGVEKHPSIGFKSKTVEKAGEKGYKVTGDFSLHGVTKSVVLRMEKVGEGQDPWGKYRMGFEGHLTIKRSEYGMDKMIPMLGDEVHITLSIEGIRQ